MKKIAILTIGLSIIVSLSYSQNEVDALRYSYTMPVGTARYTGMAGSFGALGADPSTLIFNPAGIGVYKTSDISFTPSFEFNNSTTNYLDKTRSYEYFGMKFNHVSYIGTLPIYDELHNQHSYFNFGFSYNKLNSFNENIIIDGQNYENSITDYFAARANGIHPSMLYDEDNFYSHLAYEQYLINPVSPNATNYVSAFNRYGERQKQLIERRGNQGEYNIALSGNIQHKLFLGMSLGIQDIYFREVKTLEENDPDDIIANFKSLRFKENLNTQGTGYNIKLGFLYSPVESLRIGAGFHTPTIINLHDDYSTSLKGNFDYQYDKNDSETSLDGSYDYVLKTPAKFNASIAGIFEKFLINFDYELVNYSKAQLRVKDSWGLNNSWGLNDDVFEYANENIDLIYKAVSNMKVGLEYREGMFKYRLGFGYFESPYKSNEINRNNYSMMYSAGLGFRFDDAYIDIGYSLLDNKDLYYNMYSGYGVESPMAKINKTQHRIAITFGVKF